MTTERGEIVILSMLEEASRSDQIRREKREARELRIKREQEFLKRAEDLMGKFGVQSPDGERETWRTPSIVLSVETGPVHIHVAKYVSYGTNILIKDFVIEADVQEQSLFQVMQVFETDSRKNPKSVATWNHLGSEASDEEVLGGLQAIKFIERRLNNRQFT